MRTITVIARIHKPEMSESIDVEVYSSIGEVIDKLGSRRMLEIINQHLVADARLKWRNRKIDELVGK